SGVDFTLAERFHQSTKCFSRIDVVIDDQDAMVALDGRGDIALDRDRCEVRPSQWQPDREFAPSILTGAVRGDRTPMHVAKRLGQRQADAKTRAEPWARATPLIEHFKQVIQGFLRNADTVVRYGYIYVVVITRYT